MKVKEIIQPFYKELSDFIQTKGDKKVKFFYVKQDNEYNLVDIDNTYFHHDDDGQIIIRINDFDDENKTLQQVYRRVNKLTVKETLDSLKTEIEEFLQQNGDKNFVINGLSDTEYYIEEEQFANNIFISICDSNNSGIAIDSINKVKFDFNDGHIILKIE